MTPKQKYDTRKQLRTDRLLREELRVRDYQKKQDDVAEQMTRTLIAFERIADVLELWADMQGEKP